MTKRKPKRKPRRTIATVFGPQAVTPLRVRGRLFMHHLTTGPGGPPDRSFVVVSHHPTGHRVFWMSSRRRKTANVLMDSLARRFDWRFSNAYGSKFAKIKGKVRAALIAGGVKYLRPEVKP